MIVTAFDPFGGLAANPSERLLRAVEARLPAGDLAVVLPTSFGRAWPTLEAVLAGRSPDEPAVLLGYAASADGLRLERQAANRSTARGADNDGVALVGALDEGGPDVQRSVVEVDALVARLEGAGVPVTASTDAGGFVCNATYYRALRHATGGRRAVLFVHVGDWEDDPVHRAAVPTALLALLDHLRAPRSVAAGR